MINMESISTKIKEALQLQLDRNEFLKDSRYAEFAFSDEKMMEELMETYAKIIQKEFKETIIHKERFKR